MDKSEKIHWIGAVTFFLALSLFMFRVPLAENDPYYFEMSSDLQIPTRWENIFGERYPLWNYLSISSMTRFGLPVYFLIYVFSSPFQTHPMIISEIIWVISQFVAGLSMYCLTYFVLKRNYRDGSANTLFLASIVSALFYMSNTFIGLQIRHQDMKLEYALTPLLFLMFIISFEKIEYRYVIATSFLWMLSAMEPRSIYYSFIFFIISFMYHLFTSTFNTEQGFLFNLKKGVKTAISLVVFYGLFSSYYIIPHLLSSLSAGPPKPGYVITIEMLILYSGSPFLDAIKVRDWKFEELLTPTPQFLQYPLVSGTLSILSFVLPIIAYMSLLLKPKNKDLMFFSIFTILFSILSTGARYPYTGDFYLWLVFNAPLHEWYSWSLRMVRRMLEFLTFFFPILLGFSTAEIVSRIRKCKIHRLIRTMFSLLSMALLLSSIILPSWPLLTGDFNGEIKPFKVPTEYFTVNNWLEEQEGDFKVMWMPTYLGESVVWLQDEWYRERGGSKLKWLDLYSSSKPTYGCMSQHRARPTDIFHFYIGSEFTERRFDVIQANKTKRMGQLLAPLNVRYLILHDDIITEEPETGLIALNFLYSQEDLKLVKNEGFLYVFENERDISPVYVPQQVILTSGGLSTLSTLTSIDSFNSTETAVQFLVQDLVKEQYYFDIYDTVIANNWLDLLPHLIKKGQRVFPFDYTNHFNPKKMWSKARINDPSHYAYWHPFLEEYDIDNWEFDYGKGLVFTMASESNPTMDMPLNIEQAGEYTLLIRYFQSEHGGNIKVYLDEKTSWDVATKSDVNTFAWKELGSVNLTNRKHALTLENLEGDLNAVNLITLIPREEMQRCKYEAYELLKNKRVIHIFEPEFDLYYENSTISNEFGCDASNGKVLKVTNNGRAWAPIEVLKDGNYTLALRVKGDLVVNVGKNEYAASSWGTNGPDWTYIHNIPLESGPNIIELYPKTPEKELIIDSILIYSTEGENETLEDVFTPRGSPARVTEYRQIDFTKWVVRVEATEPFMLALAETYDPLWAAEVDGDEVKSIPLYSIINGFQINKTGMLEITIEFKPQRWFYYGLTITLTALSGSFTYLAWSWLRKRELKARLIGKLSDLWRHRKYKLKTKA